MNSPREDLTASIGECRETHVSWVFLGAREAVKVKKPVSLGFLDFSTADKRKAACEAEDSLNRRLAPDVYLGVTPITRDASGRHAVGGSGEVVDWAVRMRRLPDEERGDALLAAGRLGRRDARRIAGVLAGFHARARSDEHTASFGRVEALRFNTAGNLRQSRRHPLQEVPHALLAEVGTYQARFLRENASLFESRRQAGFVRDGHGDLRLDQLYIHNGKVLALDCIEFDERFRCVDTAADAAFLSMDFRRRGRPDLAEIFLASYARASGDYGLYRLIDFYESQRAQVRSLVAGILADDTTAPPDVRDAARADAAKCMRLARDVGRRTAVEARLIAIGGIIGAGKSAVADALSDEWAVPVVDSDRVRKRFFGEPVDKSLASGAWTGAYDEGTTRRVYDQLVEAAEDVLRSGRTVILDASFRSRVVRQAARGVAQLLQVPFLFIECRADPAVCRARLRAREGKSEVSDARETLWDAFRAKWEPVDELSPDEHLLLDTGGPLSKALRELERTRLDRAHDPRKGAREGQKRGARAGRT